MEEMNPVVVDLTGQLENPGESLPVSGRVDVSSFVVGEKEFSVADGIAYDVVFTNAGDGILVTGLVRAVVTGTCDRCLDQATLDISGEIEEYYLFEAPEDQEAYEDGFELIGEDRLIDLAGPINDAVVMDVPYVVLCQPDCRGLCPTCGANLNRDQCDCAERAEQDWVDSDENPFAALKNLTFDD